MHLILGTLWGRLMAVIVAGIGAWLVQQVPGLDPAHAESIAKILVSYPLSAIAMAFTAGWLLFSRPGDQSTKVLDDYRELLRLGLDPTAPPPPVAARPPEVK